MYYINMNGGDCKVKGVKWKGVLLAGMLPLSACAHHLSDYSPHERALTGAVNYCVVYEPIGSDTWTPQQQARFENCRTAKYNELLPIAEADDP